MKKSILLIVICLWQFHFAHAQCNVDAGNDLSMCVDVFGKIDSIELSPILNGTQGNVSYEWSFAANIGLGTTITGSMLLNDTSIASPYFMQAALLENNKWYPMYLTIHDSAGFSCTDSFLFRISKFNCMLGYIEKRVAPNTSVSISSLSGGGISPYCFHWSPDYNISDTATENPIVSPGKTTAYKCIVTDAIGCVSDCGVSPVIIVDSALAAIPTLSPHFVSIFPNPINDNSKLFFATGGTHHILLYNNLGQLLLFDKAEGYAYLIGNKIISRGEYYVIIVDENEIIGKEKVVKE